MYILCQVYKKQQINIHAVFIIKCSLEHYSLHEVKKQKSASLVQEELNHTCIRLNAHLLFYRNVEHTQIYI